MSELPLMAEWQSDNVTDLSYTFSTQAERGTMKCFMEKKKQGKKSK